jgi:hypothetical protein
MDAVLYYSYLFPFVGVQREDTTAVGSDRSLVQSSITRYTVDVEGADGGGDLLVDSQSASTSFVVKRAYYQMARLMSYLYVIGGWAEAHTLPDGTAVPEGPIGSVERHQQ